MNRGFFTEEHTAFRQVVRSFFANEIAPTLPDWERAGRPPRSFWRRAGQLGLLGIQIPVKYGGAGETSFLFNAVLTEEAQRAGLPLGGLRVHTDICMPYFLTHATAKARERWLPRIASGDAVTALAVSEPAAGSDVRGITTHARLEGDTYVINGAKTFISNGQEADLVIVVVKTGDPKRRDGLSLLVVEAGMPGFGRGPGLDKIGLQGQDLAELTFDGVRVPSSNLLGQAGQGYDYLVANFAQERLSIAVSCQAAAATALASTVDYVRSRQAFGQPISSFQNTKFELAACAAEVEAGQALIDRALLDHESGRLSASSAAMAKLFCSELQGRVVDRCVQLHGGYGYMRELAIARAYADARASRIFGGSSEVMKVIISKSLGL
jgi:acyl-CoA dehydrogenase